MPVFVSKTEFRPRSFTHFDSKVQPWRKSVLSYKCPFWSRVSEAAELNAPSSANKQRDLSAAATTTGLILFWFFHNTDEKRRRARANPSLHLWLATRITYAVPLNCLFLFKYNRAAWCTDVMSDSTTRARFSSVDQPISKNKAPVVVHTTRSKSIGTARPILLFPSSKRWLGPQARILSFISWNAHLDVLNNF